MKVQSKVGLFIILIALLTVACAFASPDGFLGMVNLLRSSGQIIQTAQNANQVGAITSQALNDPIDTVNKGLQGAGEVVATAIAPQPTARIKDQQTQRVIVVTATPEAQQSNADQPATPEVIVVTATPQATEENTEQPATPVVIVVTNTPEPQPAALSTAQVAETQPTASVSKSGGRRTRTNINNTTATDTPSQAVAPTSVPPAPTQEPQQLAGAIADSVDPKPAGKQVDKLVVTSSNTDMILHYVAVDAFNNIDLNNEQDYIVTPEVWCEVVRNKSFIDPGDQHEILSFGHRNALSHAYSKKLHGQPYDWMVIKEFTQRMCGDVNPSEIDGILISFVSQP